MTDMGWIDLLGEVAGLGGYEEVKKNSEVMAIFEMDCLVLSLEGLIRAKKAAGRSRDLEVIPELEGLLDLRRRSRSSGAKNGFRAYKLQGLEGTCWEATSSSPVKADSLGRRFKRFFGGEADEIGIVVFLRNVRRNKISAPPRRNHRGRKDIR